MNRKDEQLLREFLKKEILPVVRSSQRQEYLKERKVRSWVRNIISEVKRENVLKTLFEAKDMTNPHPNTGINKLRDAIRKAKPSIKTKYQQLTTDPSQRESFTNHFLGAMIRMFDELDALSAQGKEAEDISSDFGGETSSSGLAAPPEEMTSDEMADDLADDGEFSIVENILREIEVDIQDDEAEQNDVVSDDFKDDDEKEKIKNKSQIEKDFEKKSNVEKERKKFGDGIEGDSTGRNQSFDAFNLVQSYFSDAYLDLNNEEDQEMYKKWCLYNVKLLLDKYEEELASNPDAPDIENPT
jgi:hypothetical protein